MTFSAPAGFRWTGLLLLSFLSCGKAFTESLLFISGRSQFSKVEQSSIAELSSCSSHLWLRRHNNKYTSGSTRCRSTQTLSSPSSEAAASSGEGKGPQQQGTKKKKKKGKNINPAMGDTAFLRKRTEHLLRVTAPGYESGAGNNGILISRRGMKGDQKTFNWLIDAWAFSGELDAAERAHSLLVRMEQLNNGSSSNTTTAASSHSNIRPDVRSYTKVINAISRSGRPDAGDLAEKLLARMNRLYESGQNTAVKPNTFTYTAVVEAHANSGAPGSAVKAEEICDIMVRKHDEGDADVRPTARSFNAVINAWAKSGQIGAVQHADDCLDRMEELYEAGNADVKPNAFNFNSVITAWANCGEEGSAQRAEELLERMERLYQAGEDDVKPTTVSFNAVIDAWAKSGRDEFGAEKAEELLHRMEQLHEDGTNIDAKPNVRSFNSVINAWAKSGHEDAALKAEGVLDRMENLYQSGNEDVRPDPFSFSTVINAWARSQQKGKAERSNNILRQMKDLYDDGNKLVKPNTIIFNSVMNACAFTSGDIREQSRAIEIAHSLLRELEQSSFGKPDQVTYGTFLKVLAHQMHSCDSRNQVVQILFQKCCKGGQVGNFVLQQLKMVASNELYEELIGKGIDEEIRVDDLPSEWSCNVVEGKWRRRRRRWG